MKRLLTALLALLIFTVPVLAEETDYTSMSLEELYAIRDAVNAEIESRGKSEENMIYVGEYHIGKDMDPGAYVLYGAKGTIICHIYDTEEDFDSHKEEINDFVSEDGHYVGLTDGMVFKVLNGNGYITKAPENYDDSKIYVGTYHVGTDIEPGTYVISGLESTIIAHVYDSEEDYTNHKASINTFVPTTGYSVTLEEGMVFKVLNGNGHIVRSK